MKSERKQAGNGEFQLLTFPVTFTTYPYISCTMNNGGQYWANVQWNCGSTFTNTHLITWLVGTDVTITGGNVSFDLLAIGY